MAQTRFGNNLAQLGSSVDLLLEREGSLRDELKGLLSNVPASFSVSTDTSWDEVPSQITKADCTTDSSSVGTGVAQSRLTASILVGREASSSAGSSGTGLTSGSTNTTSNGNGTSGRRSRARFSDTADRKTASRSTTTTNGCGNSRSQSSRPGRRSDLRLRAPNKKSISSDDVSNLYQSINEKKENKNENFPSFELKGVKNGPPKMRLKQRNNCDDSTIDTCDTSTSSSTECCTPREICVRTCVKLPICRLKRLRPTGISFVFQITPIHTTLRRCNSILRHRFDRCFLKKIEDKLCEFGIERGILRRLPDMLSPVHQVQSGGYPQGVLAKISFRCGTIDLGYPALPQIKNFSRQFYGVNTQPVLRHPRPTVFGMDRGEWLSNFMSWGFNIDLSHSDSLEKFISRATNPRDTSSSSSSRRSSCDDQGQNNLNSSSRRRGRNSQWLESEFENEDDFENDDENWDAEFM